MRLLDNFFNIFRPTVWFITCTYSKHGGAQYPMRPKSKQHQGNAVSNQWMQSTFNQGVRPTMAEIYDTVKSVHPKASNIKVESIIKLQ